MLLFSLKFVLLYDPISDPVCDPIRSDPDFVDAAMLPFIYSKRLDRYPSLENDKIKSKIFSSINRSDYSGMVGYLEFPEYIPVVF